MLVKELLASAASFFCVDYQLWSNLVAQVLNQWRFRISSTAFASGSDIAGSASDLFTDQSITGEIVSAAEVAPMLLSNNIIALIAVMAVAAIIVSALHLAGRPPKGHLPSEDSRLVFEYP